MASPAPTTKPGRTLRTTGTTARPAAAGEDLAAVAAAPEGAAAYFIRSSLWSDTPMDRSFVAATRLAKWHMRMPAAVLLPSSSNGWT